MVRVEAVELQRESGVPSPQKRTLRDPSGSEHNALNAFLQNLKLRNEVIV